MVTKTKNSGDFLTARLVVHGLDEMKTKERTALLKWLEDQVFALKTGRNYSKRYTARYFTRMK